MQAPCVVTQPVRILIVQPQTSLLLASVTAVIKATRVYKLLRVEIDPMSVRTIGKGGRQFEKQLSMLQCEQKSNVVCMQLTQCYKTDVTSVRKKKKKKRWQYEQNCVSRV